MDGGGRGPRLPPVGPPVSDEARRGVRIHPDVVGAGVAALLATVVAVLSLRVWEWRPGVPPSLVGDSPVVLTQIDEILRNGWFWSSDAVGFPLGQNASFFPELNVIHVLGVKALGLLGGDAATVGLRLLLPRLPARRRHDLPPRPQRAARATGIRRRRGALRRRALPRRALRAPLARVVLDPPPRPVGGARGGARPDAVRPRVRVGPPSPRAHPARPHPRRAQRRVLRRVHPRAHRRRPRAACRRGAATGMVAGRPGEHGVARRRRRAPPRRREAGHVGHGHDRPAARDAHPPGVGALRRAGHRPAAAVRGPPARAARRPHAGLHGRRAPGHRDAGARARRGRRDGGARAHRPAGARHGTPGARPAAAVGSALDRRRGLLHGRGPGQRGRAPRHAPAARLVALLPRHPAARAAGGRALAEPPPGPSPRRRAPGARPRGRRARPDQPGARAPVRRHRGPARRHPLVHRSAGGRHGTGVRGAAAPGHAVPRGLPARGVRRQRPARAAPDRPPARVEPRRHERHAGGRLVRRDRPRGPVDAGRRPPGSGVLRGRGRHRGRGPDRARGGWG